MGEPAPQLDRNVYLYGIVPWHHQESLGAIGLFGGEVRFLPVGRLAAVVSEVPDGTDHIRPERRNLAAHQAVVTRLTSNGGGILPVAFGTVSPSDEELTELLSAHESELAEQFDRFGRSLEMEVRLEVKISNAFEYFVNSHPELREARDAVFGKPGGPSRDDKIGLGQLFQQVLNRERESVTALIQEGLAGASVDIRRNDCRNENEMARLSILVSRERQADLDRAIDEVAGKLGDQYALYVTGPFPAYSFVDLHLKAAR